MTTKDGLPNALLWTYVDICFQVDICLLVLPPTKPFLLSVCVLKLMAVFLTDQADCVVESAPLLLRL